MNTRVEFRNTIQVLSFQAMHWNLAICFLFLTLLGCANSGRSLDLKSFYAAGSLDANSFAKTQATLALNRAETAEREGKMDEAIRYYEQAQTLDPDLAHLSRRLAVLYDQRGDETKARTHYERALQLNPRDPDLLNDFGVFHLHCEHWSAAETWFRRALAIDATHQRATNNLAMSLAMQNRWQESYEAFSRVAGPAAAHSNLGVLLTKQGRLDEARQHFERALALDPTIHPAGEFLSRLDQLSKEKLASSRESSLQPVSYQARTLGNLP